MSIMFLLVPRCNPDVNENTIFVKRYEYWCFYIFYAIKFMNVFRRTKVICGQQNEKSYIVGEKGHLQI